MTEKKRIPGDAVVSPNFEAEAPRRPEDKFELAPKVELHLHLEGAIPPGALLSLIDDPEVPDGEALNHRLTYRDFSHFIATWVWMTGFLRTEDAFTAVAEAVARDLTRQNIVYAEASFSPTDFARHGLTPQQIGTAIRRGLDRVPEITVVLICDLVRDTGPERAARTLEAVIEIAREADIRGITIGGSEQHFPPEPFAQVYQRAREAGLHLTAHAGEAAGPESILGALECLGVERVGHGVRAIEDPFLVSRLVADQVPLELCPTSNLRTGVVPGWASHPAGELLAAGANITISTDDPTFFHNSLAGEFRELDSRYGELADMERLTLNAVAGSWLEPKERSALAEMVRSWWTAARTPGLSGSAERSS